MNTCYTAKVICVALQVIGSLLMWSDFGKTSAAVIDDGLSRAAADTAEKQAMLPHVKSRLAEFKRAKWGAFLLALGSLGGLL